MGQVVDNFQDVRTYLVLCNSELHCVNPHLARNSELVAKLADWEQSCELREQQLADLDDLVHELRCCRGTSNELQILCEDRDAEFFLVLPRLVWLWFLAKPLPGARLLRTVLPHLCAEATDSDSSPSFCAELEELGQRYRSLLDAGVDRGQVVQRAIVGAGSVVGSVDHAVEDFVLEIERWSMELQRHDPEDWNQCAALLSHYLNELPRANVMSFNRIISL